MAVVVAVLITMLAVLVDQVAAAAVFQEVLAGLQVRLGKVMLAVQGLVPVKVAEEEAAQGL
jgi:predicted amidohydrolase